MDTQDPGGPRAGGPRSPRAERAGLAPVLAFFLVAAVAIVLGGAVFATREAAPSEPPAPPPSPDYSLTDEEAIAEFERLNAQLIAAYEERNVALAEAVFTSDSPMLPRVRKEIQRLIRSSVLSRTRFQEQSTKVLSRSSTATVLERTEVLYPNFRTEEGSDATGDAQPERRVVRWELRLEVGAWLIHDGTVVRRDIVRQRKGS